MRAIDTNVLARYYLQDDHAQARIASAVLAGGDLFVPRTVILELEWVLRFVAEQPPEKVFACLAHLLGLPGVTVEDSDEIETALKFCQHGLDFSDALHLAASGACRELLTFDRQFAARSRRRALKPSVRLPTV